MTGNQNIPRLASEPIAHPVGRVIRLQVARGRQFRQRVAGSPERLGRLPGAELTAVPYDRRPGAACGSLGRRIVNRRTADSGQRAPRIDIRTDGVAVMNKINPQILKS